MRNPYENERKSYGKFALFALDAQLRPRLSYNIFIAINILQANQLKSVKNIHKTLAKK